MCGRLGIHLVQLHILEQLQKRDRPPEDTVGDICIEQQAAGGQADTLEISTENGQEPRGHSGGFIHTVLIGRKESSAANGDGLLVDPGAVAENDVERVDYVWELGKGAVVAPILHGLEIFHQDVDGDRVRAVELDVPVVDSIAGIGVLYLNDGILRQIQLLKERSPCPCTRWQASAPEGPALLQRQLNQLGELAALGSLHIVTLPA